MLTDYGRVDDGNGDLIAAFLRDGLRTGHKVICWTDTITPDVLADQLAARSVRPGAALRRGQLRLPPRRPGRCWAPARSVLDLRSLLVPT